MPRANQHPVPIQRQADFRIGRQGSEYIEQFSARNRNLAILFNINFTAGHQFNLEVRRGNRQMALFGHEQHVGQDWHGLPSLDNTDYRLQWFEKYFSLSAKLH
ncbi:hypothetical protein MnTg04_00089 [bacterium MnTg04]|nr:hypothetical protein MnTg04_00089 [bacterium MnTg04]